MFNEVCHSIESGSEGTLTKITCPFRLFAKAVPAGMAVGTGALILTKLATELVARDPALFIVVIALAFVMATLFKMFFSSRMYTNVTLITAVAVLRGTATRAGFAVSLVSAVLGNLTGAFLVAYLAYRYVGLQDTTVLEAIATKKSNASFMTLLAQGVLCNWSLMLAAWACVRVRGLSARVAILALAFFFFVCSGYEHGVVNAALLMLANLNTHGEAVTWSGLVANLAPVILGNLASGALVSLFGYYAVQVPTQIPTLARVDEVPATAP